MYSCSQLQKSGDASQNGMVDLVEDDADVDRIGGQAPVVLERDLHAGFAAVVGQLLERLDAVARGTTRARRPSDSRSVTTATGAMRGPPLFTRIDFAPMTLPRVQPFLGDRNAGLAPLRVHVAEVARRVVGDVLALRPGRHHLGRPACRATAVPTRSPDRIPRPRARRSRHATYIVSSVDVTEQS